MIRELEVAAKLDAQMLRLQKRWSQLLKRKVKVLKLIGRKCE